MKTRRETPKYRPCVIEVIVVTRSANASILGWRAPIGGLESQYVNSSLRWITAISGGTTNTRICVLGMRLRTQVWTCMSTWAGHVPHQIGASLAGTSTTSTRHPVGNADATPTKSSWHWINAAAMQAMPTQAMTVWAIPMWAVPM